MATTKTTPKRTSSGSSSRAAGRSGSGRAASGRSRSGAADNDDNTTNGSLRGTLLRSAAGAVVGGAAYGVAGRLANRHSRMPKLPKGLDARRLTRHVDVTRLGRNVDIKDVVRQIGNIAEQVETRSEDIRTLSAQAKRVSRRIS